jgi:hypothetical protein
MDPLYFLWLILALSAAAVATQMLMELRRARELRRLAAQWQMQFFPDDRFRLALRIAPRLPAIGAADVRARNLMYRGEDGRRHYLFTVEYGTGALGGQRRRRCVAALDEAAAGEGTLRIAPADLAVIEQYRRLHKAEA